MRNVRLMAVCLSVVLAISVALVVAKTPKGSPAVFQGKDAKTAGADLLALAESQAGEGSWELIGVGRISYLSGNKEKGQAMFDRATSKKPAVSDLRRIAAVYVEAGELEKAEAALRKALALDAKDSKVLAELGAVLNLRGDRAGAEGMFKSSLEASPDEVWNTLNMAGSYLGVKPN